MTASPRQRELPELPPLIHQAVLDPLLEEEALQNSQSTDTEGLAQPDF